MDRLNMELARMGKDPAKTASIAPSGSDNAVFDLSAVLVDANGGVLTPQEIAGGAEVFSVRLEWTEQLSGDYDQNGEVNIGDLTPMAQYWQGVVDYDDPALHGGFTRWPSGNPEDDGGGQPPPPGSGANNWRRARVDGDGNGEINIADITPIAAHWQEAMNGHRVYRKAPGESSFTALADGGGMILSDGDLSLDRPTVSASLPVRYAFGDADAIGTPGVYQYYSTPFDEASQQEGPKSAVISIDVATGEVNSAPVAKLSVSPDFGGAPAIITLDASGS
jgi:hypothetical protein